MAPLTNKTTSSFPLFKIGGLALIKNPTVTPTDKALYILGLTIAFISLLGDILIFFFLLYKLYRRFRPHVPWYSSTFPNGIPRLPRSPPPPVIPNDALKTASMRNWHTTPPAHDEATLRADGKRWKYHEDDDAAFATGVGQTLRSTHDDIEENKENFAPHKGDAKLSTAYQIANMRHQNAIEILKRDGPIKPGQFPDRRPNYMGLFPPSQRRWAATPPVFANHVKGANEPVGGFDGI
ncbi:MAG: hypothetical protein Q9182_006637 [Xanthomendoza sp. 2 TL-2023]